MDKRIGVYICACGGNISDYVNIEKVREAVKDENAVVLSKTTMFACGDANQKDMDSDIKENNLSGIVVASCSPKLHLSTFRAVSERAGLNKYNYVHANIREQASWAHSDNKEGATQKAILLVKAAIAKARHAVSLEPIRIKSQNSVAVIGAGIAGIKAAQALSAMNDLVYLIEKEEKIGGSLLKINTVAPETVSGEAIIKRLSGEIAKEQNITLLTGYQVAESKGNIGDFTLKLQKNLQSGEGNPSERVINVGSVLVATGFDSYTPKSGEYGFGTIPGVVTLEHFNSLLRKQKEKVFTVDGKKIKSVAFIYCVGSRQIKGENSYCSRYCCTAALRSALDTTEKFPGIDIYHLTRGMRSYGKQELLYKEANKRGDLFIQFPDREPPVIEDGDGEIIVRVKDILSGKRELEANVDMVVLVTGMVSAKGDNTGAIFKLPRGRDNFYNEIHMKLRPVETAIDGITIAGCCQGPKNSMESVNSALAAAIKSHSIVSKGELELEPIVAFVDEMKCSWCGKCLQTCPFNAITPIDKGGKRIAEITNSVCKGCGMCLPVCPEDALELISFTNKEIEDMIDVLSQ
ncbi:MAG: FAD-dependent oxidoreductase [Bacteroidales bacterium]|nr:FAD-dependent oxidoreductase [Bacteroidales bacterium]MDD2424933.1 FAD-dependent oxidoreductase [Bacteroidales bacterium]MDD3989085.1 FAD-dependent oxidoreductase [Bacteroidales bacterium]MDD4638468.1 FAD-dependent oxidoreductase [Bacteroidales bacterium]